MTQELRKLADDLDAEFAQGRISNHNGRKAAAEIRLLLDRVEKAKKDAERYRWLRDSEWEMFADRWLCECHIYGEGPDELNAAIDAAMEASK